MTIKWVQLDPLVMNGEPFCYGSRLTVRQLLELRANGYDLTSILTDHPELRVLGIAAAYVYAAATASATRSSSSRTARSPARPHRRGSGRPSRQYRVPGIVVGIGPRRELSRTRVRRKGHIRA